MITAYSQNNGKLNPCVIDKQEDLIKNAVWIDLVNPSEEEYQWIKEVYDQDLPALDTLVEIEASSRFFQDVSGLHLRSYFIHETLESSHNVNVAFILNQDYLFTLRDEALISFKLYQQKVEKDFSSENATFDIMLGIFEVKVDRLADLLEQLHFEVEALNTNVLVKEQKLGDVLTQLMTIQNRNDNSLLSMMDKQRVLSFLLRSKKCPKETEELLREILQDLRSLKDHSTFLFEKVQFLMDAIMGRINIEQNKIIKIFSIAAVVFLPPTLIASIYGMNFHNMPELSWRYGYPLAIILMIAAGIAPYLYFKAKGWLK